jgi:hypothetical protein
MTMDKTSRPSTSSLEWLTDWDKVREGLEASRDKEPERGAGAELQAEPPRRERDRPSLSDLDKVADWGKLRGMMEAARGKGTGIAHGGSSSPQPHAQGALEGVGEAGPNDAKEISGTSEAARKGPDKNNDQARGHGAEKATRSADKSPGLNRFMADCAVAGSAKAAAAFMGRAQTPEDGALVLAAFAAAGARALNSHGKGGQGDSLLAALGERGDNLKAFSPDGLRAFLEERSEAAKDLFGRLDDAVKAGYERATPPPMSNGRDLEGAIAAGGRAAVRAFKGSKRDDPDYVWRPDSVGARGLRRGSGMLPERGMRRERGDYRVEGGGIRGF